MGKLALKMELFAISSSKLNFIFDFLHLSQAEEFTDPEVHHRHLSHLFGLFPGHSITVEETPDLCKAAENTLIKRGWYSSNDSIFHPK